MKVRNDQRKTISLSQYEYVDLRIKDISAMEGITESVIIEEILLRKREPLFPASPCLTDMVHRYYTDENGCTKLYRNFFMILAGHIVDYTPDKELQVVKSLHSHLCFSSSLIENAERLPLELIGLHIKTIREHLEHCLCVAEAELSKISSKIDSRSAAEKYTKHSEDKYKLTKDIRFANDLIDFFIDRPQYASYHTVTQLILSCWDFVRSIPATYNVLGLVAEMNPVPNSAYNRYNLINCLYSASEDWDF